MQLKIAFSKSLDENRAYIIIEDELFAVLKRTPDNLVSMYTPYESIIIMTSRVDPAPNLATAKEHILNNLETRIKGVSRSERSNLKLHIDISYIDAFGVARFLREITPIVNWREDARSYLDEIVEFKEI